MENPVNFRCICQLQNIIELLYKKPPCLLVRLIHRKLIPHVHYIFVRLQLGHAARDHQREQIQKKVRIPANYHERILAQNSKALELKRTLGVSCSFGDHLGEVSGKNKRHSFTFKPVFCLEMSQEMTKVYVE